MRSEQMRPYSMIYIYIVGVAGVYAGTAVDELIRGLIVMYYWYRKKWLGKSVIER